MNLAEHPERAPLPPRELMVRVSGNDGSEYFLEAGRRARVCVDELAPDGWSWDGHRALDFGCGAGRTLRHFLPDAERGEFWGCDIDGPSIRWLEEHLSPPLRPFRVGGRPVLPQPDGHFDAIWGLSVFSHIDRDWAEWLLELRRVLADEGWLLLTFLGDGMTEIWDQLAPDEEWDPDRVGMAVFKPWARWDEGGPTVFLSEWWLRARWGRAFTIERFEPRGFASGMGESLGDGAAEDHGFVILRKRPGEVTAEDLRRPDPEEPREAIAALAGSERLRGELDRLYESRSWQLTVPVRAAGRTLRRMRQRNGRRPA